MDFGLPGPAGTGVCFGALRCGLVQYSGTTRPAITSSWIWATAAL
jgi:hypothetical protein